MPKPLKKTDRPKDVNQLAYHLVKLSTQGTESAETQTQDKPFNLSEYMAKIGRKGGQIGGKRRLKTMTRKRRRAIAKKAATARWAARPSDQEGK